jgi:hypothetical protein
MDAALDDDVNQILKIATDFIKGSPIFMNLSTLFDFSQLWINLHSGTTRRMKKTDDHGGKTDRYKAKKGNPHCHDHPEGGHWLAFSL